MSKRYIDADALIAEMERCSYETWSKGVNPTWWTQAVKVKDNIVQCIERQPAVDVAELRLELEDIPFQEEMWSVLGDMTEAQAKEAVKFFKEKYNWKES